MPPQTRSRTVAKESKTKPTRKPAPKPKDAKPQGTKPKGTKPKGSHPLGIQKPSRPTKRQKITAADIAAMAPLAWPYPSYTYLELQPPDEDEMESNNGYVNRHLKKAKKDYNGSEIKISAEAYDRLVKMYIECEKRSPESNGIDHIFEDYRGLGTMEVIEAQILDYAKELKRSNPCEFKLFAIAEAMAFFTDGAWDATWFNVEDGEGVDALFNFIGTMFADCFRRLDRECHPMAPVISPPHLSPLKNLALVMGLAVGFAEQMNELLGEEEPTIWQKEILRLAKMRGMVLRNTKGLIGEKDPEEGSAEVVESRKKEGDKFDFLAQMAIYKKNSGKLGGTYYDLTKQGPSRRRK